jgi:hypothetical protein
MRGASCINNTTMLHGEEFIMKETGVKAKAGSKDQHVEVFNAI